MILFFNEKLKYLFKLFFHIFIYLFLFIQPSKALDQPPKALDEVRSETLATYDLGQKAIEEKVKEGLQKNVHNFSQKVLDIFFKKINALSFSKREELYTNIGFLLTKSVDSNTGNELYNNLVGYTSNHYSDENILTEIRKSVEGLKRKEHSSAWTFEFAQPIIINTTKAMNSAKKPFANLWRHVWKPVPLNDLTKALLSGPVLDSRTTGDLIDIFANGKAQDDKKVKEAKKQAWHSIAEAEFADKEVASLKSDLTTQEKFAKTILESRLWLRSGAPKDPVEYARQQTEIANKNLLLASKRAQLKKLTLSAYLSVQTLREIEFTAAQAKVDQAKQLLAKATQETEKTFRKQELATAEATLGKIREEKLSVENLVSKAKEDLTEVVASTQIKFKTEVAKIEQKSGQLKEQLDKVSEKANLQLKNTNDSSNGEEKVSGKIKKAEEDLKWLEEKLVKGKEEEELLQSDLVKKRIDEEIIYGKKHNLRPYFDGWTPKMRLHFRNWWDTHSSPVIQAAKDSFKKVEKENKKTEQEKAAQVAEIEKLKSERNIITEVTSSMSQKLADETRTKDKITRELSTLETQRILMLDQIRRNASKQGTCDKKTGCEEIQDTLKDFVRRALILGTKRGEEEARKARVANNKEMQEYNKQEKEIVTHAVTHTAQARQVISTVRQDFIDRWTRNIAGLTQDRNELTSEIKNNSERISSTKNPVYLYYLNRVRSKLLQEEKHLTDQIAEQEIAVAQMKDKPAPSVMIPSIAEKGLSGLRLGDRLRQWFLTNGLPVKNPSLTGLNGRIPPTIVPKTIVPTTIVPKNSSPWRGVDVKSGLQMSPSRRPASVDDLMLMDQDDDDDDDDEF